MNRYVLFAAAAIAMTVIVIVSVSSPVANENGDSDMNVTLQLPDPATDGEVSLERSVARRRSRRMFSDQNLSLGQAGQILWSAQGITCRDRGFRAAPSAGATYPLKLFIATGEGTVQGLKAGVYRYDPQAHQLRQVIEGDVRSEIARASLRQQFIADAPMVVVFAADYDRTTGRYGERGIRYVHMEVGHAGGHIYLQCEALGLATVAVGAFDDDRLKAAAGLPRDLDGLYVMPVGYPDE